MTFNPRHLLRMARWARHPPGERRVRLVLAVIVLALAIIGLERVFGTPGVDAARTHATGAGVALT
ncbi:MAG: hypothetical protein R3D59_17855 [Paracoccaceae bacterium]